MAFTSSVSITLMVKGTLASELRTRFCPIRFTYSLTTGSVISLDVASTCWEYCLPMRISLSKEYQLPKPRFPKSRLPIASTSSRLPSFTLTWSFCGTTSGRACGWTTAAGAASAGLLASGLVSVTGGFTSGCLSSCARANEQRANTSKVTHVVAVNRTFMISPGLPRSLHLDRDPSGLNQLDARIDRGVIRSTSYATYATADSVVVLKAKVRDQLRPLEVPQGVLQLHQLDEQIVLRIEPWHGHG